MSWISAVWIIALARVILCPEDKENVYLISEAEAGINILRFLERRVNLPRPSLFRLLRTGQVRVNKGRVRPNYLLAGQDKVRLPAFLVFKAPLPQFDATSDDPAALPNLGHDLALLQADKHWLVLHKAPGLATQPGSGQADSVSARMKRLFGHNAFIPQPAHRLDKQSSGLLLAGRTHLGLRYLHKLFAENKGDLRRLYLVWVAGLWDLPEPVRFRDFLIRQKDPGGLERMRALPQPATGALEALAEYRALKQLPRSPCGPATLLEARLLSGRRHQIRIQCASRGHPVIGDQRYNGPSYFRLFLHAWQISLPGPQAYLGEIFPAAHFTLPPDWPEPFAFRPVFGYCRS